MKIHTKILLCLIFCLGISCTAQRNIEEDRLAIEKVMKAQEVAWSKHDLEGFMQGYWKSEDLAFFGSNGVTKGWQQTLDNYKKGYPNKEDTGKLTFEIKQVAPIEKETYYVMGTYHLSRTKGDANGTFMIIFKKIDGEWKIIADSSC